MASLYYLLFSIPAFYLMNLGARSMGFGLIGTLVVSVIAAQLLVMGRDIAMHSKTKDKD